MSKLRSAFLFNTVFAAAIFAAASNAQAGFIMTIQQVGSDVVETGSGTINFSALSYLADPTGYSHVDASVGYIAAGIGSGGGAIYSGISGPSSFGSGAQFNQNSNSGDYVGLYGSSHVLYVPAGYVSGAELSDTSTWTSTTLAALGLTTGVYTWTWGSGATADSFQLDIGQSSAPEPSTFGLLALAAGLLMLGCYFRRARVVKMDAACSSPSGRISLTEM